MKNGRYFNFWDICDRNLWDAGYLAKEIQGYGILRLPLMAPQYLSNRAPNLVPRAFSSTIFKMADRREKTLAKAGSRGTKSPKILEIFIT